MKKYKAFTLIEVLISIVLFSMIVIFLYQTLDMTTKSNLFYEKKLNEKLDINLFKKILFLDLLNKTSDVNITKDRRGNSVVTFKTSHIYHNPFYSYITYVISKENNFLRLESKIKFNKDKLNDKFFDTLYVDKLQNNIKKFRFKKQSNGNITYYILKKNNQKILFGLDL